MVRASGKSERQNGSNVTAKTAVDEAQRFVNGRILDILNGSRCHVAAAPPLPALAPVWAGCREGAQAISRTRPTSVAPVSTYLIRQPN